GLLDPVRGICLRDIDRQCFHMILSIEGSLQLLQQIAVPRNGQYFPIMIADQCARCGVTYSACCTCENDQSFLHLFTLDRGHLYIIGIWGSKATCGLPEAMGPATCMCGRA